MLAARRDKLLWCGGRYQLRSDKQVKGVPAMQRNRTMDSAGRPRETSLEGFASTCSILAVGLFVGLPPWLTQTVKTLFAVR